MRISRKVERLEKQFAELHMQRQKARLAVAALRDEIECRAATKPDSSYQEGYLDGMEKALQILERNQP